jgi:hypothetical protein
MIKCLALVVLLVSLGCAWLSPTRLFAFRRKPEWAQVTLTPGVALKQRFQLLAQQDGNVGSVATQRQQIYLGSGPYFQIFDPAKAEAPQFVGQSAALPGVVQRIALQDSRPDYAYLLLEDSSLHVIDHSDPLKPAHAGSLEQPTQTGGIAIRGDMAYLTSINLQPPLDDPQALRSLRSIDISDPTNPRQVGLLKMAKNAAAIAIQDRYLYYPDRVDIPELANAGQAALHVIDISDPTQPVEVAQADTTPLCPNATSIAIQENTLYLGATVGETLVSLCIFDISDPLHPRRMSAWDGAPPIYDLAVAGSRVFAACGPFVAAIDISDPRAPRLEDLITLPGTAVDIAVQDDLIYVAGLDGGLSVLRYR